MSALDQVGSWPVTTAAVAVVGRGGVLDAFGPQDVPLRWASVTKVLTAMATWVAIEEGTISLDDLAGPPGATVGHLLAHASGLAFDGDATLARPGERRIYSNRGFEVLAGALAARAGMTFGDYLAEGVLEPLGLTGTRLEGSPASGATGPAGDLARLAAELLSPTLLDPSTVGSMTTVAFPRLVGVLPGYGRQDPNDWAYGVEVRGHKSPHWTPPSSSPRTFGHFGQAGGFLWVDPDAEVACACLTDRNYSTWAAEVWPPLGEAVLAEHGHR